MVGVIVEFNVYDGSITSEGGKDFPGVVGMHVNKLLETRKGSEYVIFLDNFYSTVGIARHLLLRDIRLVGTLRTSAMTDFDRLVRFGNAKSMKPSKVNPKRKYRLVKTIDGKIFAIDLMDTRVVYFLDSAFGYKLTEVSRSQKGQQNSLMFMAPTAVYLYKKYMGGVDELDRLRMGMHGFEGVGSAHKWTSRMFDCCMNILMQTDYKIYKCCRDRNLGNEEPTTHAEFNESVIGHLLHNDGLRKEKLTSSKKKRVCVDLPTRYRVSVQRILRRLSLLSQHGYG